jgi:hypothetical protein
VTSNERAEESVPGGSAHEKEAVFYAFSRAFQCAETIQERIGGIIRRRNKKGK